MMEVSYIQQAVLQLGLVLSHPVAARSWEAPPAINSQLPSSHLFLEQDTTRKASPRDSLSPRMFDLRVPSRLFGKPRTDSPLGHFNTMKLQNAPSEQLDYEAVDSLGKLHPELKTYLLRELAIQEFLSYERLRYSVMNNRRGGIFEFEPPSELEGKLRRNQQMFGTTNNPMRPPPPPNQVDLMELVSAVRNLLRALGVK
jgi:hypothetical protein